MNHTPETLIAFEAMIADTFNAGEIKAPVHLHSGNEKQLIEIFKRYKITDDDWVLSSWRSHYHCLLKGVPEKELYDACLEGRSIGLCFRKHKILCSGIVGGVLPIGVGIGYALKQQRLPGHVYVFVGDMTAETGIMHESSKYSDLLGLPVTFIIEDNKKSVCTDTSLTWGRRTGIRDGNGSNRRELLLIRENVDYYEYDGSKYPHAGAGKRVQF